MPRVSPYCHLIGMAAMREMVPNSITAACNAGGLAASRYYYEDILASRIDKLRDKFIIDACMP